MGLTPSNMLPLGTDAPDFNLVNTIDDQMISPTTYAANKPFVVAFIYNHCPFVVHIMDQFTAIANTYQKRGIAFIAISANDISTHPDDAPEHMRTLALAKQFEFPYCYDADQSVAKAYDAACTPDFYLFDQAHKLVYRGRFDDATPNNAVAVTGQDLCQAMDALLDNQPISPEQTASIGCNIKWLS